MPKNTTDSSDVAPRLPSALAALGLALATLCPPALAWSQEPQPSPATSSSSMQRIHQRPIGAATGRIARVKMVGVPDELAHQLIPSLRSQAGQAPSRQAVQDDIELLLASGQISRVVPEWKELVDGWELTYHLSQGTAPSTEPDLQWQATMNGLRLVMSERTEALKPVVRGQSEEEPTVEDGPAPSSSRLIGKAPMLPRDPEDFEGTGIQKVNVTLEDPLVDVRIEGNVTIPVSEVQKHVKVRPGRATTQTMIKEDVDALVRTRWFISVEPIVSRNSEGLVLTYRVLERPIVRNVEYRGIKKIKREKLEALTNLKVGSPYDVSANRECARRIEELYHEKGFAFATVELEKGNHTDDREVIFVINEGPKVKVADVDFQGNKFFSEPLLDLKLQTKKRILWSFGGKYDPATIPNDKASITKYYRSLGFFDMEISHDLKFNADKSQVTIVYNIVEGPRYMIRNVEIMGNDVISEEILRSDHTITNGEYFTERKLAADVDKMREKYGTLGRLFAKVDAVPRFTEEPGVVDILYKIDEDKVYRVREFNVHIAGDHPHTRTNLVRNISMIQPGDLADPKKIQRTKSRLAGSSYFEAQGDLAPRLEISRVEEPGWLQIPSQEMVRGQTTPGPWSPVGSMPAPPLRPAEALAPATASSRNQVDQIGGYTTIGSKTAGHTVGSPPKDAAPPSAQPGVVRTVPRPQPTPPAAQPAALPGATLFPALPVKSHSPAGKARVPTSEPVSQQPATAPAAQPMSSVEHREASTAPRIQRSLRSTPERSPNDAFTPLVTSSTLAGEAVAMQESVPQNGAEEDELVRTARAIIRGQGDALLAQSQGPMPVPQNYLWDNNPQGNPLGNAIRDPDPNLWDQLPPPEFIDIDAYLAEARTGRLMFGVGVNSDAGVIGNIVLSENNFDISRPPTSFEDIWNGTAWRGAGEKFRIEALPGSKVSRYLVDWQNPYFMDTDVNLGVSGFYYTRFFRYWDEQRLGGRVRLGRQFSQTWAGNVALRLENVTISDAFSPAPSDLTDAIGDNLLSTVRFGLSHDTRDAAFLPSSGHYVEFGVEQAFAEYNYSRLEVEGRQYFTTYQRPDGGGKHIVNLHGNFGWTSSGTPIFEKFYAGGFQSFRGFAFRGVTPLKGGVEVGGQFMLLGSVEYQVPVLANEMVKVVAFSDFGTVEEDVQFDNFRMSVGGGLRIQVPGMGPVPVALDWAVPVLKSDFDREQLFSFYIGINR